MYLQYWHINLWQTEEKPLFIVGVTSFENSDCFRLILISFSNFLLKSNFIYLYRCFDWLKTHCKTVKIYDAVSLIIFVLVAENITFRNEIAFKTTVGENKLQKRN